MKIYTKTGDKGQTGLFGGGRVSKSSLRVATYGDVDELNNHIGVARAHCDDDRTDGALHAIQSDLFCLGAELATTPGKQPAKGTRQLESQDVTRLESLIDDLEQDLQLLKNFVLPGGCPEASFLHVTRGACRRAERSLVSLAESQSVRDTSLQYLNRLSDLLFVMARHANFRANIDDVPWQGRNENKES